MLSRIAGDDICMIIVHIYIYYIYILTDVSNVSCVTDISNVSCVSDIPTHCMLSRIAARTLSLNAE